MSHPGPPSNLSLQLPGVLLKDSLLSKAMPFPGWRTPAMDQGVSVRASQFQHNSGLLWWNIPAPRLLCGHPSLSLALHSSLIHPYVNCAPFSFFGSQALPFMDILHRKLHPSLLPEEPSLWQGWWGMVRQMPWLSYLCLLLFSFPSSCPLPFYFR